METDNTYAGAYTNEFKTVAVASKHLRHLSALTPRRAVIYARDSDRSQEDNLPHQARRISQAAKRLGFEVVGKMEVVESGSESCRDGFERAVLMAKNGPDVIIIAEAVNRFKRNYGRRHWMKPLYELEMRELLADADGVQLVTVDHPDAPPEKVHSEQTKRGQQGRGNVGGRPPVEHPFKERRLRLSGQVIEKRKVGWSYRQIADQFGIARNTAKAWAKTARPAGTC